MPTNNNERLFLPKVRLVGDPPIRVFVAYSDRIPIYLKQRNESILCVFSILCMHNITFMSG